MFNKPLIILLSLTLLIAIPTWVKGQSNKFFISVDNDIFNLQNQTDRYYTNGLNIGVFHTKLNNSFINKILVKGNSDFLHTTGLTFYQGIYTPIDIYTEELQNQDRPYASVALLKQEHVSVSSTFNLRIFSSIGVGLIGKYSGGAFVQNAIHGLTPHSENANGWDNQIANDILIDYQVKAEKGIINSNYFQLDFNGLGQIGTYRNQVGIGTKVLIGFFDQAYESAFSRDLKKDFTFKLFAEVGTNYMFYDATMQGGVFNKESIYTLSYNDLNQFRYNYAFGVQINYKSLQLEGGRIWQSSEASVQGDHAWGYIQLSWFIE